METILAILAVYGITTIMIYSDGPFNVFFKLRRFDLFDCFLCLSVYIAALVSLLIADSVGEWLLFMFAFSGGAILLENLTD